MNGTCAGGTGAFIDQMATLLGYDAATFASLGLKSKNSVDLGSRCTVFMNSSVKQAQKTEHPKLIVREKRFTTAHTQARCIMESVIQITVSGIHTVQYFQCLPLQTKAFMLML